MTSGTEVTPEVRLTARLATYPPGTSFGPRELDCHQLVWLLSGSARWTIDDRPAMSVGTGTLLLGRPGEVDHYLWDPRVPSTHAYVQFDLPDGISDAWPESREFSTMPVLEALCDYLLDVGGDEGQASLHTQVLSTVLQIHAAGPAQSRRTVSPLLSQMLDHVRLVWQRDGLRIVPADELAAAVNISPGHVFRTFRSELGLGPGEVLERVRLSRATTTLRRSNATVAEVAELCGYANAFHFSRRFAAHLGLPPGAYRRQTQPDLLDVVKRHRLGWVAARVLDPRG